jgi:hypothetical protein
LAELKGSFEWVSSDGGDDGKPSCDAGLGRAGIGADGKEERRQW